MTTRPFHDVCAGYYQTRLDAARAAGDRDAEQTVLRLMQELADREVAKHRGARTDATETDTVHRFDTHTTELQPMPTKTFTEHLRDCGGDVREAERRFHADGFESRRPTASTTRLDANEAEQAQRLRSLTAWCRTDEERKQVQRKLAEQADQDARKQHLARVRFDAAPAKCKVCGDALTEMDTGELCATHAADEAERASKRRNAARSRGPLQVSKPGWGGGGDAA